MPILPNHRSKINLFREFPIPLTLASLGAKPIKPHTYLSPPLYSSNLPHNRHIRDLPTIKTLAHKRTTTQRHHQALGHQTLKLAVIPRLARVQIALQRVVRRVLEHVERVVHLRPVAHSEGRHRGRDVGRATALVRSGHRIGLSHGVRHPRPGGGRCVVVPGLMRVEARIARHEEEVVRAHRVVRELQQRAVVVAVQALADLGAREIAQAVARVGCAEVFGLC